ncbi:MAG TPA: hypothetical protein VMT89_18825 [Candidatus Acidoferrales bacterium]|nr:hypothetical protein [Candidatus Acidoferrales bacterium]
MQFSSSQTLSHPAPLVLDTMIHNMEAIVPFLPNVESIATEKSEELSNRQIRIVRHWTGAIDAAPAIVRPFLPAEWLGWTDTAVWTPAEYKVEWTHTPTVTRLASLYDCNGTNYFEPDPTNPTKQTRIRIAGNLVVHPSVLPGVPRFLADRMAPQVEKFIINLVTPNLSDLVSGLQRYLDRQQKRPAKRPK